MTPREEGIVERLRRCDVTSCGTDEGEGCIVGKECRERNEAADEIERLQGENAALRESATQEHARLEAEIERLRSELDALRGERKPVAYYEDVSGCWIFGRWEDRPDRPVLALALLHPEEGGEGDV